MGFFCYWIDKNQHQTWNKKFKGFIPSRVQAGKGHQPLWNPKDKLQQPWIWGDTYEEAIKNCEYHNQTELGLTKDQVQEMCRKAWNT